MSPSPHHLLARFVVGAVLAVPTVYFATVLFPAIRDVSLSEGFSHIRSNVWATCALIDYVAGLCFTVPYMWFRSPNLVVGVIVVVACTILGNVVSVALFVVLIWTGRGTLRDSVLPLHHTLHAPNTKTWGVLVFQWCIGTLGLIYWAYLFYALAT
ncbi:hypothetical protein H310_07330 [Aphanomyces invadans]|uniref:Uncharacterized protein n=1 Tax=Aphanomyces invadans TaxID=157072 RepID=A0A024U2Z6_9STRA|nr:hypothetical protein H310_07330 [Aphanomyces invadans]ETW00796.1 hypothetical protein H310_07330 [Aphanomyces invadans]|eukprot:XP_008870931.1 hypothetical protein H310_07330 [Aphanomyces invadans]